METDEGAKARDSKLRFFRFLSHDSDSTVQGGKRMMTLRLVEVIKQRKKQSPSPDEGFFKRLFSFPN